ncbi:MAG: TOBE domain-containing protein, partial [Rubellimicrobium sp.]|nr:TOBE domain-containing protein [Rubellimicrobium sp.]
PGTLTIRPEAIRPGPAPENTLMMTVTDRSFLGTRTRLTLTAAGQTLEATLPPDIAHGIEAGQQVTLHLPRAALWVLPHA